MSKWDYEETSFLDDAFSDGEHIKIDREFRLDDQRLSDLPKLGGAIEKMCEGISGFEFIENGFGFDKPTKRSKVKWYVELRIQGFRPMTPDEKSEFSTQREDLKSSKLQDIERRDRRILGLIKDRNPHLLEELL